MRTYSAAKASRLTTGWGTVTTSEDAELASSLRTLRNRSRELVRDAAYAKRAKVIVQNNVIGAGIGLQAKVANTRGGLNDRINDDIEAAWSTWARASSCHTGGALHFCDLERALMGQVFEAGEIFVRLHFRPFGESAVPLALEVIEPERLADEFQPTPVLSTAAVRLGIEVDQFHRPLAYWIRTVHPGDIRLIPDRIMEIERVPAELILHLRVVDRWPQSRGVPWLHAAARRLNDMDGLGEAEITAARGAACYMGTIQSPQGETTYGETTESGANEVALEPGIVEHLAPGEEFNFVAPNRPNSQLDPFMRLMLREVAAGVGSSYESLSRDYSKSNYSSSRLALLDDRDLWRTLQSWFIRSFRAPVHRIWLQQAVLSRAITSIGLEEYGANREKFEAVSFKPRGWSWIDPTKEVDAYEKAIRCGFTTVTDVIAKTGDGRDLEEVLKEREHELTMMKDKGLVFDTDPAQVAPSSPVPSQEATKEDEEEPESSDEVEEAERILRGAIHA